MWEINGDKTVKRLVNFALRVRRLWFVLRKSNPRRLELASGTIYFTLFAKFNIDIIIIDHVTHTPLGENSWFPSIDQDFNQFIDKRPQNWRIRNKLIKIKQTFYDVLSYWSRRKIIWSLFFGGTKFEINKRFKIVGNISIGRGKISVFSNILYILNWKYYLSFNFGKVTLHSQNTTISNIYLNYHFWYIKFQTSKINQFTIWKKKNDSQNYVL